MKPGPKKKKLTLSASTVRALTPPELARSAGGYGYSYDRMCTGTTYCGTANCVTNGSICTPSGQYICEPNSGQLICV